MLVWIQHYVMRQDTAKLRNCLKVRDDNHYDKDKDKDRENDKEKDGGIGHCHLALKR